VHNSCGSATQLSLVVLLLLLLVVRGGGGEWWWLLSSAGVAVGFTNAVEPTA
jgi:hypothetical protein